MTATTYWYCPRHGQLTPSVVYRDRDDVFRCQTPDDDDPDLPHLVCGRIAYAHGTARMAAPTKPSGVYVG